MKKFILAFAIVAVLGTSGFFVVNKYLPAGNGDNESTTTLSSAVSDNTSVSAKAVTQQQTSSTSRTEKTTQQADEEKTFDAEIVSVKSNVFELKSPAVTQEISESDRINATVDRKNVFDSNGKDVRDDDFANFTKATVTYSGDFLKTSPLSVNAQKIVLSKREKCNVYFYFDGKIIKTLTLSVGAALDAADMPNAGAYCDDGYHFDGWTDESGKAVFSIGNVTDSIVLNAKISHD